MNTAYCVKCKKVVEISDAAEAQIAGRGGGRKTLQGKCPHCGKTVIRITGK